MKFSERIKSYKNKEKQSLEKISGEEYKIKKCTWDLKKIELNRVFLDKELKYEKNLNRFKNRINIEKIFFDTYIYEAKRIEQLIIHVFKDKLANNKNILAIKGGYSEIFIADILDLDN